MIVFFVIPIPPPCSPSKGEPFFSEALVNSDGPPRLVSPLLFFFFFLLCVSCQTSFSRRRHECLRTHRLLDCFFELRIKNPPCAWASRPVDSPPPAVAAAHYVSRFPCQSAWTAAIPRHPIPRPTSIRTGGIALTRLFFLLFL